MGTVLKKKGGAKGGKRTTRGAVATKKGPRSFAALLDEAMLDRVPREIPTYLTAAAGPSVTATARKYCSVCGFASNYNCARCGMKFCSRKCNAVHAETRCLKFTALTPSLLAPTNAGNIAHLITIVEYLAITTSRHRPKGFEGAESSSFPNPTTTLQP